MPEIRVPLDDRRVTGHTIALCRSHMDADRICDIFNGKLTDEDRSVAFHVIGDADGYRVIQLFGERVDDDDTS